MTLSREAQDAQPLSGEDKFRRKYPLGIEKDFKKRYGYFPTTEEMIVEIAKLKRTGEWVGQPDNLRPR